MDDGFLGLFSSISSSIDNLSVHTMALSSVTFGFAAQNHIPFFVYLRFHLRICFILHTCSLIYDKNVLHEQILVMLYFRIYNNKRKPLQSDLNYVKKEN